MCFFSSSFLLLTHTLFLDYYHYSLIPLTPFFPAPSIRCKPLYLTEEDPLETTVCNPQRFDIARQQQKIREEKLTGRAVFVVVAMVFRAWRSCEVQDQCPTAQTQLQLRFIPLQPFTRNANRPVIFDERLRFANSDRIHQTPRNRQTR